ncbi:nascent polypeptide-associated complex subunit alpha, muscle-specific form-like [Pecten maximus]|uniref:nascent polypeptide-associated complex subunit alpha, muscle-specific form-like n=1 Tax=Pecten maximus TaxID=6579 RepID=UPI0014585C8C|nr:nascent polypeptide-associated complex subunit alpha, muscle-specific form-like [Pecten maximus]
MQLSVNSVAGLQMDILEIHHREDGLEDLLREVKGLLEPEAPLPSTPKGPVDGTSPSGTPPSTGTEESKTHVDPTPQLESETSSPPGSVRAPLAEPEKTDLEGDNIPPETSGGGDTPSPTRGPTKTPGLPSGETESDPQEASPEPRLYPRGIPFRTADRPDGPLAVPKVPLGVPLPTLRLMEEMKATAVPLEPRLAPSMSHPTSGPVLSTPAEKASLLIPGVIPAGDPRGDPRGSRGDIYTRKRFLGMGGHRLCPPP